MKTRTLIIALAIVVSTSAQACDLTGAKVASSEAQNYARLAAYAAETARETEDADVQAESTQEAVNAARLAEQTADSIMAMLADCE